MLTQIDYYLEKCDTSDFYSEESAKIHGFLLDKMDDGVAAAIHNSKINPFSLFLAEADKYNILRVTSYNELGYNIISTLNSFNEISLIGNNTKKIKILVKNEVFNKTLNEIKILPLKKKFNMAFITPTAFKQYEMYNPVFSVESIIKSVNSKLKEFFNEFLSEDDISKICRSVIVTDFNLSVKPFINDSIKINGFVGNVKINFKGKEDIISKGNYIFRLASLFGVGVKTGMGMGGIVIN